MYDTHILTDVGCRNVWEHGKKVGWQVNLTINYYRGLPLTCIDEISLEMDGVAVDPSTMYVETSGRKYPYLDLLGETISTDIYWTFGEYLTVIVMQDGGIEQGNHHVKLTLGTRRSYTPTMLSVCEKDLTFA